jgi:hypothetical protein
VKCTAPFVHERPQTKFCDAHRCPKCLVHKMQNQKKVCDKCSSGAPTEDAAQRSNEAPIEDAQCSYWYNGAHRCTNPAVHKNQTAFCELHRCKTCPEGKLCKMASRRTACTVCNQKRANAAGATLSHKRKAQHQPEVSTERLKEIRKYSLRNAQTADEDSYVEARKRRRVVIQ